jgi:glycosyltransferase involved in cell wall biosynthesis
LLGKALEQLGAAVWFTNSLPDEVTAEQLPGLIISHQFAMTPAISFAQRHNIPLVMYVHGPEQYEQFFDDKNSPALTLFCSAHQQYLVRVKYPDINSTVLYPVIEEHKYITMVGSGIHKGQDVFFKAAASMPDEQFLLVGDADPQLNALLPNLTIRPVQSGLTDVFEHTKLLMAPTQVESYGRVIVEAGCYGIPAIITNLPGPKEAASFTKAAIVYRRDDIAEWHTAIRTVLNNYGHYSTMARELVEARKQQAAINAVAGKIIAISNN